MLIISAKEQAWIIPILSCTTQGRVSIIQALREEQKASTIWIILVIHVGDLTSVHKSLVETLPNKDFMTKN